jgi:hypothetical protein
LTYSGLKKYDDAEKGDLPTTAVVRGNERDNYYGRTDIAHRLHLKIGYSMPRFFAACSEVGPQVAQEVCQRRVVTALIGGLAATANKAYIG